MGFFGNLTMRRYAATNLILGAMFINLLLFGGRLEMGEAFTAGLATGLGVGWLAFGIGGWIALKRPGRTWDERTATINAANDLYGAGSAESMAVAAAWTAVNRP